MGHSRIKFLEESVWFKNSLTHQTGSRFSVWFPRKFEHFAFVQIPRAGNFDFIANSRRSGT